ncbi:MAG: CgeB family protein [Syntrophorhabdaceae bacterium]
MAKIVINSPRFYGIDDAIRESFETIGFNAILLNYGTKITIQETIARRIGLKIKQLKPFFNPVLKHYLQKENDELIDTVRREKPDLLFIIKGDHLFPETLRELKRNASCPIIAYIWDDPFYSYAGLFSDDFRKNNFDKGMDLYDYIFVYDTYYVEQIRKRGIVNVGYLPLAADPNRYRNISLSEEDKGRYGYDICFVGVPYPNRLEILEKLGHYNLGVFGAGWKNYFFEKGKPTPSYYKGEATGDKVLKIYLSSKIVLNIHDPEAREGLNTRTFDILACGASEVVDHKKNVEVHFKVGEEIVTFKDHDELIKLIGHYLENDGSLREISDKGRQRVLNEHTWLHRVNSVMDTIKERGIVSKDFG